VQDASLPRCLIPAGLVLVPALVLFFAIVNRVGSTARAFLVGDDCLFSLLGVQDASLPRCLVPAGLVLVPALVIWFAIINRVGSAARAILVGDDRVCGLPSLFGMQDASLPR